MPSNAIHPQPLRPCRALCWLAASLLVGLALRPGAPAVAGTVGEPPELVAERSLSASGTVKTLAAAKPAQPIKLIHTLTPDDCAEVAQLVQAGIAMRPPVDGTFTQPFTAQHPGVDVIAPATAPIRAAHAGQVTFAGWNHDGYGLLVTIQHAPIVITSPMTIQVQLKTHYAHLSRIDVAPGAVITSGQALGEIGDTGRADGPHLHFEVRLDSVAVNPACFWPVGAASTD